MSVRYAFRIPLLPPDVDPTGIAARGTRRWLILVMAGFATVVEALSVAGLVPDIRVGALDLSLSLIPALGLAVACGARLFGRSSFRRIAAGFWVVSGLSLVALAAAYHQTDRWPLFTGLVAAALGEELVYRLAVPAALAAVLQFGGVRSNHARVAGLTLAGLWFVLLPGHQDQVTSVASDLSFFAFAVLSAVLVYRSGSVLPMAASHAIVNLVTVLMWDRAVAADERGITIIVVLGLLVAAYGRPRRLTLDRDRGLIDTVTGLAVTEVHRPDHGRARAVLSDGRVLTGPSLA